MPFGTIRNPLTVGASGQSDGSAYRALAESLAQQQGQAGPSSGLNALNAVLGVLAQQTNLNRASEADQAYEQRRMKEYQDFMSQQEKAKAMAAQAGKQAERADLEKLADEGGFQGPLRAAFIANNGQLPAEALIPRQQNGYDAWLASQSPDVQAQAYQVKAGLAPRAQAPGQGPGPSEMDRKVAQLRALGASDEQIRQSLLGNGGASAAPSGYRPTQDGGGLEAIPGGPADPANKPPTIAPEVAARAALTGEYLDNATGIRERIAQGDMTGPVDFMTAQVGYGEQGETRRQMLSGVDALRRGLTGAGMSAAEAGDYVQRYLPAPQDNAETLLSKHDQLVEELTRYKSNMEQGRTPLRQPTAGAPKRRRYNPQTDSFD